ncbi:MAG: acylneuraminate cytidylyltransferase family protein [Armatimonadetes bacterium]|nr:acylneuraminate cytidylyltransferase family protein [Armatimonadota bacterium]MBS1712335.1 acylneuraminate cytidylyltransferase family protein [Armatimonadota bacterium]MBX3108043.1 acylneuraminate cytidylyltransferase family protein [Fimbriimonadaceae bacterium]
MSSVHPVLAVVPARGGSKGLPGKNIRPLGDLPLIGYAIKCALNSPSVAKVVCSTDSMEIADVAREMGAELPFMRPAELASDTSAMWPVVRHALDCACSHYGVDFQSVLLLDPTSPGRTPEDVETAIRSLEADPGADAVVGVSEPEFNPIWHCVVESGGYMRDLVPEGRTYTRRQDLPSVYRINASLYLWRAAFVRSAENWRDGKSLLHIISESRAVHVDTPEDFAHAEEALGKGLIWQPPR